MVSFKGGIAIVLVVILVGFGCREMKFSCRDLTIMELKQFKHRMFWHCNSPCGDTSGFWMSWNEMFIWWFDHHGVKFLAKHGVIIIIPVPKSGLISLALMMTDQGVVWWYQLFLYSWWVVSIMWFSVILTNLDEGEMERLFIVDAMFLVTQQKFLGSVEYSIDLPLLGVVHCYGCAVADLNQIYYDVYLLACKLQPL